MTRAELNKKYFDWMYQLVCGRFGRASYKRLLTYLYDREFTYLLDLDGNRASDGEDLRYRFGSEAGYLDPIIATYLDNRPCSVLEMMVALAIRCEEHIMEDSDIGDRTGQWFWEMIVSLGLDDMSDDRFDIWHTGEIIDIFLEREYKRDGRGSLFTVEHAKKDMRTTEIWYQMCAYLETII